MKVYRAFNQVEKIDSVIELIAMQMTFIGSVKTKEEIKSSLKNALSNRSAVLFVDYKDNATAFAFANISSGLESGGDYLWVNELFVDPDYRNKGQATKLLTAIEAFAKEVNIKYIALSTSSENEKALTLYKKQGYEVDQTMWVDKTLSEV
jgi:ribosomal protein S18 acetylase RimI-like enzyme